jgi:hypothetical protein
MGMDRGAPSRAAIIARPPQPASVQSDSFYEPLSASRNALHQRNMQAYNQMGQMSRGATRIGEIAATVGQGGAAPDLFPNMTPSQRQMLQAYRMDAPPVAVPEGYGYQNGQYTPQYDPMRQANQRPVPGQMYAGGSTVVGGRGGRMGLVGPGAVPGVTPPSNEALYQRDQNVMAERRLRRAEARFGPGAGSEADRMRVRQQQPAAAQPATAVAPQGVQPIEPISFSAPAEARAARARYDELVANPNVDALFAPLSADPANPIKFGDAPPEAFFELFMNSRDDSESYQTLQELFRHKVAFDAEFLKELDPRMRDQLEQLSGMPLTVPNRRSRRGRTR